MSSVLSRLKTLGDRDLSATVSSNSLALTELANFGIIGTIGTLAVDPVQGLVAVGTDKGRVYILGQANVEFSFNISSYQPIKEIRFVGSNLIVVDNARNMLVFDMLAKELLYQHTIPGNYAVIEADPSLDWLFIGMESGQVLVYDLDRGNMAPLRIDNLQKAKFPKLRLSPVVSLELHPCEVSMLLVGYRDCAVTFSIVSNSPVKYFVYELPAGAPGGELDIKNTRAKKRSPQLSQALWHPNGHHILTVHCDGSLVFWDSYEAVLLHARTILDTFVNLPQSADNSLDGSQVRESFKKVTWNCLENPDETSLLILGGDVKRGSVSSVSVLDFDVTPHYSTTSYERAGQFYSTPKRQRTIPVSESLTAMSFINIPRSNPFYRGNHDPRAFLVLFETGEVELFSFPSGLPLSSSNLPSPLCWVESLLISISSAIFTRESFLGLMSSSIKNEQLFSGGLPAIHRGSNGYKSKNVMCAVGANGSVKIYDSTQFDTEYSSVLNVDVRGLTGKYNAEVEAASLSGMNGEMAVSTKNGEVILFKFGSNKLGAKRNPASKIPFITSIQDKIPSYVRSGFLPVSTVDIQKGSVSVIKNSDVGFVGIGYKNGTLAVVDRRGPAVIFLKDIGIASDTPSSTSRGLFKSSKKVPTNEFATAIEFAIMSVDDDSFSSLLMLVGTDRGNVHTYRIMPVSNGKFQVAFYSKMNAVGTSIESLMSINIDSGLSAAATIADMTNLAQGVLTIGYTVVMSKIEVAIVRPPKGKVAHRKLPASLASSGLAFGGQKKSTALVCVLDTAEVAVMRIPSLRISKELKIDHNIEPVYLRDSLVLSSGDIFLRTHRTSGVLLNIWGRGVPLDNTLPKCELFNPNREMPLRPTYSTVEWLKGSQVTSTEDLNRLIGGPNRVMSKRQMEEKRARERQQNLITRTTGNTGGNRTDSPWAAGNNNGGGIFSGWQETLNNIEQAGSDCFNSFDDTIKSTQTNVLKSAFKAKFF
ncbi:hypothetical protein NADFUDRAFT_52302 [Nadsonia fulvescens var. elongata DSM 6958]|uniref:Lethal giant larvae (Lgl)-like C-terminal domain-containing protein n=1 Tax=Nadsonia fulvescens var. elongata DSM 6958 TaxID=857566 RepID=A0A1E3PGX9_9ASCO|nr:hypothetical protein NADFUDRAFT_52302 [Nadsonia fulvescens var. elongata DSM 6958]